MGESKVIEMPKVHVTEDSISLSVLSTFSKIEKMDRSDSSYISKLTVFDMKNIENAYTAACIYSALGMFNESQQMAAKMDIESLIGNYSYSIDMYRLFVRVYGDLLKYKETKKLNNIQTFEENNQSLCKLA